MHLRKAQQFYTELRTSTQMAKDNENIASIAFDFEQNFPLPHIPAGEIFYLHQIWLHVFGIHDCGENNAAMYCWPETVARKGSNEVSCLHHYLNGLNPGIERLNLFSDSCGGQNKNSTVIQYLCILSYDVVTLDIFGIFFRCEGTHSCHVTEISPRQRQRKGKWKEYTRQGSGWILYVQQGSESLTKLSKFNNH